ncbi:agmatine deiminase family protein [Bacteroidota bacterium]
MKKLSILVSFLLILSGTILAQKNKQTPYKYKHMLSADEEKRMHQIGKSFIETAPPLEIVRNIAEFEPMSGVMVRYPFGIPFDLIASFAEKDTVITIVENLSEETAVRSQYQSNGVDLNKCKFFHNNTDSYWTRDYGPFFIVDGNDEVGIVNFAYNRPRPNDDDVPMHLADFLGIEWYGMNVVHTGGNYMTDGYGISASTKIVYTESYDVGIPEDSVDKRMLNYLGVNTYHVLEDPNNTYIDHIDCWGKFLDVDKILIRSVPESHAQYDELEDMALYWMQQKSSWGNYYKVYRVYTPNDQPYTNSLILNGRVFVPQTGSAWDDEAIETYQKAMPGYEILGFTGSWLSTDALHCRAHEIADVHMLQIQHYPILGYQDFAANYSFTADIKDLSNKGLYPDSLKLIYRIDENEWDTASLAHKQKSIYDAQISGITDGSKIVYYLHVTDKSARSENHPYMGAIEPHVFYAGGNEPVLTLSHEEITFDTSDEIEFIIQNNFAESITIFGIDHELNFAAANPNKTLSFPLDLASDSSIVFTTYPIGSVKDSKGYNVDTLRIATIDSLYQVVIKSNEDFTQGIEIAESINTVAYPNPFNDVISIKATNLNGARYSSAFVVNISGQIVDYLNPLVENTNLVELEWNTANKEIANGFYFVSIVFDIGVKTFKVIKH